MDFVHLQQIGKDGHFLTMKLIEYLNNVIEECFILFVYKSGKGNTFPLLKKNLYMMVPAFSTSTSQNDLRGKWRYRHDKHGVIIRIYGNVFNKVNDIFVSVLGPPPVSCEKNTKGYPQVGYYGENHRGYHLQYSQEKKYVEIICVGKKGNP